MSGQTLRVFLDGRFAGRLTQSSSGDLEFAYDADYRHDDSATPLSLSMPLTAAVHRRRVVLPWLQGLLPDSDEARQAIASRFGVSPRNPFALLAHVGADAAGAVQILPPGTTSSDAGSHGQLRSVTAHEVSAMLTDVVTEYSAGVGGGRAGHFSLAGAQPKIALHRGPRGGWSVPLDATPTTHILKPVTGALARVDIAEQLTLHAAELLGNVTARSELATIGEWRVLVSTRYDRRRERSGWRRLHQEDLCQALSVSPDKKYQRRDGGPGVAAIARLLSTLPHAEDRLPAARGFFRALVFNTVAGCTDAHAKNYSLLLDRTTVRLAPLYDLITFATYWNRVDTVYAAMSIKGEYALDRITTRSLESAGRRLGLDPDEAGEIVRVTRRGVTEAFEQARDSLVETHPDAMGAADALLAGVRQLPLVRPAR